MQPSQTKSMTNFANILGKLFVNTFSKKWNWDSQGFWEKHIFYMETHFQAVKSGCCWGGFPGSGRRCLLEISWLLRGWQYAGDKEKNYDKKLLRMRMRLVTLGSAGRDWPNIATMLSFAQASQRTSFTESLTGIQSLYLNGYIWG